MNWASACRTAVVAVGAWSWASCGLAQPPANRPPQNRLPQNRLPQNQLPAASSPAGPQRLARQTPPRFDRQPQVARPPAYPPPIAEAIRTVEASLKALEQVADYSCMMVKRERIGGSLSASEHLAVKLRHEPFSVYVKYLAPDHVRGQEAIYVHGHNDNRLLAHPNGLKGRFVRTVKLDPLGKLAMEGNRYPVTEMGIKRMAESWLEEARRDVQFVPCDAKTMPGAKLDGKPCTCVELTRRQRHHDLPYQLTRLYIDAELRLPVRYEAFEWPQTPGGEPELAEEYTYRDLQPNRRFDDLDFDVQNPEYGFR